MQTPATVALDAAGVAYRALSYEHGQASDLSWGAEAAALLGLDPEAVFKTLLVDADPELLVAIVPVSTRLDLKALARIADVKKAVLCDPSRAQRVTGYIIGGISPLGQRSSLRTFIDETAILFDEVFVSGGRRGFDLGVAPEPLIDLLNARRGAISR